MNRVFFNLEKRAAIQRTLDEKFNGRTCEEVYQIWSEKYTSLDEMCVDFSVGVNQLNVILTEGAPKRT